MKTKTMRFPRFVIPALIMLFIATPSYAVKFNVDPSKIVMSVKEGEKKRDYVTVTNLDPDERIHVKSYVRDIIYLPDGSNDFPTPNSTPWSCADWIKFYPDEFDIARGGEQIVKIEVKIPAGARGGHYGVIFFEVQPSRPQLERASAANLALRIGTLLLVEVKGSTVYEAKLLKFTAKPDPKTGGFATSCFVRNNGNILIKPQGVIRVLNEKGERALEKDINPTKLGILPNTNKEFLTAFEKGKLEKGSYAVQVVIDYGADILLGGQTSISIE